MLKFKENTCSKGTCRPNQNMLFISNKHVLWESTQFPKCVSAQHYLVCCENTKNQWLFGIFVFEHQEGIHWAYEKMVRSIFITILSPTINAPPNQPKMIMPCTSRVLRLGPQSHRRLESAESLRCMSSRSAAFNEVLRLAGSKIWQFQLRQKGCRSLQSMVLRLSRKNAMSTVGMKMWQFSRCERRRQKKICSTSNRIISGIWWCYRMTRLWQVTGWSCDYFKQLKESTQNWSNLSPIDRFFPPLEKNQRFPLPSRKPIG